jgi:hypothetical protein
VSQRPDSPRPMPPPSEPEPPTLDPEIVDDDESLAETVDEFVRRDPLARERLHSIADQQELLRQCVDADVWRLVLAVDDAVVERWSDVVVAVARWAFTQGQKHPAPPPEATPDDRSGGRPPA